MAKGRNATATPIPSTKGQRNRGNRKQSRGTSSEEEVDQHSSKSPLSAMRSMNRRNSSPVRGRTLKRNNSTSDGGEGGEESGDGSSDESDASADDPDSEAEPPAVMAPSGVVRRKRNRQTGLSVSFSESCIGVGIEGKKRGRSPATPANEFEEERPSKLLKIASVASALLESSDDNDDTIYEAVNLISESEDEGDLEKMEEYAIMEEEFTPVMEANASHSRHALSASEDFTTDDEETPHFDEHFARTTNQDNFDIPISLDELSESPPCKIMQRGQRRVHFIDDVPPSGSDSEPESPVKDARDDAVSQVDQHQWAHDHGPNPPVEFELSVQSPSDQASEFDEGETTDEEVLLPKTVHRPSERLHEKPQAAQNRMPRRRSSFSAYRPSPQATGYQGPSMVSWVADPTKPIAVTDRSGTKLVYFPPTNPPVTSSQEGNSHGQSTSPKARLIASLNATDDDSDVDEDDGANQSFQDAVLGPVADQMFSDFHGARRTIGRARASSDGMTRVPALLQSIDTDDWDETDDDDDAGEKHLRIRDLIELSDSDSENGNHEDKIDNATTPAASQEKSATRAPSSSPDLPSLELPSWPALHRSPQRLGAGVKRDRHSSRASSSSSPLKQSSKVAAKVTAAAKSYSPKRLKPKH